MYIVRAMWIYMYYDEQSTFESETVVAHAKAYSSNNTPKESSFRKAFNPPIWSPRKQQLTTMFTAARMWIPMYYEEQWTLW
jgi:hypothetical protein